MSTSKPSYALSLTVSVFMVAAATSMLLFAYLRPDGGLTMFLVTLALAFIGVVVLNVVGIVKGEGDKLAKHDELSVVNPQSCPDYWTNSYDKCSGNMCTPVFKEEAGTVIMSSAFDSTRGTPISQMQAGICEARGSRVFPWLEVDNSCDAKERKV
jgi:hypothetical protein